MQKTIAKRGQQVLNDIIRPNQTDILRERSILDIVFLAYKAMNWTLGTSQPPVILLFDFKKTYDRVEWSLLERTMSMIGFNDISIKWIRAFNISPWSLWELMAPLTILSNYIGRFDKDVH